MADDVPGWLVDAVREFGRSCKQRLDGTGEPETVISPPMEELLQTVSDAVGVTMVPHGESALQELQVRPDYAIRVDAAITGYVEVKKPRATIDPSAFAGQNSTQWQRQREVANVIATTG